MNFKNFKKVALVLSILFFLTAAVSNVMKGQRDGLDSYREALGQNNDSTASVIAFNKVYKVLMHPRCMNCHPAGDIPLQGDDSHEHTMQPIRGMDGKGLYAMKCKSCHFDEGIPGPKMPPGNPKWHLPPSEMKMVFEGKSAHELAKQLVDPERNGHKSMGDLIEHASDTLVKEGWNMGGNRESPPLGYEDWKQAWIKWIETGAYAPPMDR